MSAIRSQTKAALTGYRKQGGIWVPPAVPPPPPPALPTTNLAAYFESDNIVTSGGGTLLDTWTDASGNGHDAVDDLSKVLKSTVGTFQGYQAIRNQNVWALGGTRYAFAGGGITQPGRSTGGAQTVYIIAAYDSTQSGQTIMPLHLGPVNGARTYFTLTNKIGMRGLAGSISFPGDTIILARHRYSAAPTLELWVKGATPYAFVTTEPTAAGTYTHFAAQARPIWQYGHYFYDEDTVVSGQDTSIQAYLTAKWGV